VVGEVRADKRHRNVDPGGLFDDRRERMGVSTDGEGQKAPKNTLDEHDG
jgi:hypothetical protein